MQRGFEGKAMRSARNILFALACVAAAPACGQGEEAGALQPYNAAIEQTSISGISSGAYMAAQFAVAWSSIVAGVGIVAGGPYYCAQATIWDAWNFYARPLWTAVNPCMKGPPPGQQVSIDQFDANAAAGAIDPPGNLARQKIYLFHGFNDSIVAESVTDATAAFYRHYLGEAGRHNLFYQKTVGAGHAQILQRPRGDDPLNACGDNKSPFINRCGYDQAGVILQHIYGALEPPRAGPLTGALRRFAQAPYAAPNAPDALSMAAEGFVFVPAACEAQSSCRVHIALHGCAQDAGHIGRLYVDDAGYNAWADANRIIVLYPQTIAELENPEACWDWWSYVTHGESYVTQSGRQIRAIKAMLDALTAGRPLARDEAAVAGAAPQRLIVADVSDGAAALAWTPLAGVAAYAVFRAEADGAFETVGEARGPSFADVDLRPATAYRWRVAALTGAGAGPPSPEAAAATRPTPKPCRTPGACPVMTP